MRFTGQVKIPDLDYPGLPAEVLVEDKQTELFVEGESIGRWSLVDVRAERLIASAFSLKLGGEEVTFLADQPTEFAYNGVDLMANVWARHKAMTFPLRVIATNRSRKGTKPSRIEDLREAIEGALAGVAPTALSGSASTKTKAPEPRPRTSILEEPAPFEPSPLPGEEERVESARPYRPATPAAKGRPAEDEEQAGRIVEEDLLSAASPVPEMAIEETEAPSDLEVATSRPVPSHDDPAPTDSVFKATVPWASSMAPPDLPADAEPPDLDEDLVGAADEEVIAPEPPSDPEPGPVAEEAPELEPVDEEQPRPEQPTAAVPWMAPPPEARPTPAAQPDRTPEQVTRPSETEGADRPKYVVDLGAFEDHDDHDGAPKEGRKGRDARPAPRPSRDGAPAMASSERAGIMGAVRSAFVRTRSEHEHDYVEAPGGLGIKRQICAECGHISIGVSE